MKFKRADADDAWHFLNTSDPSLATCKCCSDGAACDKWVNWITRIVDVKKENPENLLRATSELHKKHLAGKTIFYSSETRRQLQMRIYHCQLSMKVKESSTTDCMNFQFESIYETSARIWSTTELALSIFQVFVKFSTCIISTLNGVIACRS